ncbi:CLUMA_CG008791, isoform A [Clunio marinus]|uniref:CLUMA_CG008791, isoform A n=1 Tax=Clunio marinus TaxID=568069 RepID=A0A1J1I5F9_9DIPT|nr:CLUMA_CG008791, isoform A [Clunio marinus]
MENTKGLQLYKRESERESQPVTDAKYVKFIAQFVYPSLQIKTYLSVKMWKTKYRRCFLYYRKDVLKVIAIYISQVLAML